MHRHFRLTFGLCLAWTAVCALSPALYSAAWALASASREYHIGRELLEYLGKLIFLAIYACLALPSLLQFQILNKAFPTLDAGCWWIALAAALVCIVAAGASLGFAALDVADMFKGIVHPADMWALAAPLCWGIIVFGPCVALSRKSGVKARSFLLAAVFASCGESALEISWRLAGVRDVDLTNATNWDDVCLSLAHTAMLGATWGALSAAVLAGRIGAGGVAHAGSPD
jgi:hypothetical protein